jgi:hypothetical protein
MDGSRPPKELFKFHLDKNLQIRDNRPLFFRRNMRWRVNSKEYAVPFSKKGLMRGYIKYGMLTYMAWHYTKQALFAPAHGHHGNHGHHDDGHHTMTNHSDDHHQAGHHKEDHHAKHDHDKN